MEQNPELAEELLLEIDRMKEEKARLEQERDAILESAKKLEDQVAQQQQSAPKSDEPKRVWGGALAASATDSQEAGDGSTSTTGTAATSTTQPSSSDPDISFFSNRPPSEADLESVDENQADDIDNFDYIHSDLEEEEDIPLGESTTTSSATPESSTTGGTDETVSETKESTDFSLRAFLQDIGKQMENDVSSITKLILPVIKPLFSAGDTAWKYIRWVVKSARRFSERLRREAHPNQDGNAAPPKNDKKPETTSSIL